MSIVFTMIYLMINGYGFNMLIICVHIKTYSSMPFTDSVFYIFIGMNWCVLGCDWETVNMCTVNQTEWNVNWFFINTNREKIANYILNWSDTHSMDGALIFV